MMVVEHFDDAPRNSDIYLVFNIFIGNAVMHIVYSYVIIKLYSGNFPGGTFVRGKGQRLQGVLFLVKKRTVPAARLFLKGFTIEGVQFVSDGLI
ncbi:hypothetical protein GCM10008018_72490 [Paenibacillus marchantiophytorum]|uniref:Uncharacterized protein n=1 Tax=Paenibacillus marchantiophytorum TaxID=1619310 RepID=A0ABQ1FJ58_9BACL|nr:hypothetical protein [Paenibacillus marchantiophytorum]GGA17929.1 hypothetical protein GCM10008018_72490 [Paenibacillus marchantiophytorum]